MTNPGHRHSGPFAGISGSRAALVVCAGAVLFAFRHGAGPIINPQRASSQPATPSSTPNPRTVAALRQPDARLSPASSQPPRLPSPSSLAPQASPPSWPQRQRFLAATARRIHSLPSHTEVTPDSPGASLSVSGQKLSVSAITSSPSQPDDVLVADLSPDSTPEAPHTSLPRHPGFSPEEALFRTRWGWNAWAAAQRAAFLNLHAAPPP